MAWEEADFQKLAERIGKLEAAVKELDRLRKIQDEYDTGQVSNTVETIKTFRADITKLQQRLDKLEKGKK